MAKHNSTVFSNFHCSNSRHFYEFGHRMGPLHSQTHYHTHSVFCRPTRPANPRCLSPLFPRCTLGNQPVVETADGLVGQDIVPHLLFQRSDSLITLSQLSLKFSNTSLIELFLFRRQFLPSNHLLWLLSGECGPPLEK